MPRYGPREARPRLIEDYADYLRGCVEAHPRLSGRHLHREIAELGYKGGYTAVTDFLRGIRPVDEHRFELRFETPRVVWLFSMVLRCHLAAFEAFGGATGKVLYDRMKTTVTGAGPDGAPVFNPALVDLLRHHGGVPRACRPCQCQCKTTQKCQSKSAQFGCPRNPLFLFN